MEVLLFAALVESVCQPTHCGGGQRQRAENGQQTRRTLTCTSAQLCDCANAATPVSRRQRIPKLHDVFLCLARAKSQFVETGGGSVEFVVVLIDLAQGGVVLVLADPAGIQMFAQLLDLSIQLRQRGAGRVNGAQQAVQCLLLIHGRLGQRYLLLVELRRDLRGLRLAIGACFGQLRQRITLFGKVLRGLGAGGNGLAAGSAGATSSNLGASSAGYSSTYFPQALGGAWSSGVQMFANGGAFTNSIVSTPTAFGMAGGRSGVMGEAGPEAIMPLTRTSSGKLGVIAAGTSISINAPVTVMTQDRSSEGMQIDQQALSKNLQSQMRAVAEKAVADSWYPGGTSFRKANGRA
jgi:hypothetical protein